MWFVIGFVVVFVLVIVVMTLATIGKGKGLAAAPRGSQRIEVVKSGLVQSTMNQYQRAGWYLESQAVAKSLGTQARVTMTFRKG